MRILFVTPYYHPELKFGGPPKRLHAMAQALVQRGNSVTVATIHSEERHRRESINTDGVVVQYLPWIGALGYSIPTRRHELAMQIAKADVVHLFGLYTLICPLAAWHAARAEKPFVMEPMGMFIPRVRSVAVKRIYNATLTRWMARHASGIVATSNLEAHELRKLASVMRVVVRRNGIDLDEFANLPGGEQIRRRWGVEADETLVAYFGRISSKKNLHDLIDAFVSANVAHSKLVIAGPVSEPDYCRTLRHKIETCARNEDIRIEGPLYGEELKKAFSAADLFVLPSLNENFGNAAGEAVAAGVPVLLTETCGIAPIIHQRAGLAVPLGVDNLAAGLQTMLDPAKRKALVAKRDEVKRELSWDEPIAQTERLYEEIISGRNKRPTESVPDRGEGIR
jgi:glycosyltransferase involved in cell wall biosynthesis